MHRRISASLTGAAASLAFPLTSAHSPVVCSSSGVDVRCTMMRRGGSSGTGLAATMQRRFQATTGAANGDGIPTAGANRGGLITAGSFAMTSAFGVVHDIHSGSVGDDNVLQFVLTTVVCDPEVAGQAYTAATATSTTATSTAGMTTPSLAKAGKAPYPTSTLPANAIGTDKAHAMAKQSHLVTGKEQFTVRCYGGDDELLALHASLMEGSVVRVNGVLKLNKIRDAVGGVVRPASFAARMQQEAANVAGASMRYFPYIRVELGDAAAAPSATSNRMVNAGVGRAPRITHTHYKGGSVHVIAKSSTPVRAPQ